MCVIDEKLHNSTDKIHLILRPILRQLRLPVSIINQQSPPAATFDHHLLLNSCPSPDFLCPDKKRFLKIYYRKLRPPKETTRHPKKLTATAQFMSLSEHCLLVVALEHSRVLAIFCSTVFTSDHPCIESKQCNLNTWVV